jgi:hypothetical protein
MSRLLRTLLRTGLDILDQPYRVSDVRDRITDAADVMRRRIRGEDHTLRYVLSFAVGVGVGVGVGMLAAPASGEENRSTIAGKIRDVGGRIKNETDRAGDFATGTIG